MMTTSCILVALLLLSVWTSTTRALFAEEAGVFDFHWPSSGHGATRFVQPVPSSVASTTTSVITSDSPAQGHQLVASTSLRPTSCFVASRDTSTGKVQWRRNVCSTTQQRQHATTALASHGLWFSMDTSGVVRAWTMTDGALVWDSAAGVATDQPRLTTLTCTSSSQDKEDAFVVVMADETVVLLDATTGVPVGSAVQASSVLSGHRHKADARWLGVVNDNSAPQLVAAWVDTSPEGVLSTTGSDIVAVQVLVEGNELQLGDKKSRWGQCKARFAVPTWQFIPQARIMTAVTVDGKHILTCNDGSHRLIDWTTEVQPSWTRVKSLAHVENTNLVRVVGFHADGTEQMALWDMSEEKRVGVAASAVALGCGTTVTLQSDNRWMVGSTAPSEQVAVLANDASSLTTMTIVECHQDQIDVLMATAVGTTTHVRFSSKDQTVTSVQHMWTHHEGLGHISSALVLDSSHAVVVDDLAGDPKQEQKELAQRLSLPARLQAQVASILAGGSFAADRSAKDRVFGFYKMAVLVSDSLHRLYGMSMAGQDRGSVAWTVDLPQSALWHKLVHGTANSPKAVHGINGGTHAREVLVVSAMENGAVEWQCVDGAHGDVHAQGSTDTATGSPVVQVVPLLGGGACRQHALLVHQDRSISVVPNDESARTSVAQLLESSANGFFAHVVVNSHDTTSRIESLQVVQESAGEQTVFTARLVGQASFPGERIVRVAYPMRDEVVQSPCTVLGDDSLLLKYLNPHLAVMITVKEGDTSTEADPFTAALKNAKKEADLKQKKKPLGVTPKGVKPDEPDVAATVEPEPNLFVNVVDTVSGRILYRASHGNAATNSAVRAVISENWVIYSFVSTKTRKTELGVLTLHEGMLHRKAITALTSPDQLTSFSSLDARESKPVVMAKTYSLPKAVTAMGVTNTRGGISSHQLVLATVDDRIFGVERRMLDTRRPVGELKETEKLEGLRQYSELIPLVSLQALSYNLTIHAPTAILSSPTELESQTLVLAYGGPDIFFTRTSPSKGFDMLPESFNRFLLSILTVALLAAVFVTKQMATKKIVKHGWV